MKASDAREGRAKERSMPKEPEAKERLGRASRADGVRLGVVPYPRSAGHLSSQSQIRALAGGCGAWSCAVAPPRPSKQPQARPSAANIV